MKRIVYLPFIIVTILFNAVDLRAGQLSASLEKYQDSVRQLIATTQDEIVSEYLLACLAASDQLGGLEASDSRALPAFNVMKNIRIKLDDDPKYDNVRKSETIGKEDKIYNEYLQPYLKEKYVGLIALQDKLLDRKYFKTETAKNSNYAEGYLNGKMHLTRSEHNDIDKALGDDHLGVSPWEAILRLEPAITFESNSQLAILLTVGLSYVYFPDINRTTTVPSFNESFWSKYLKKSGVRIGAGAGFSDEQNQLLLGAGTQVNAIALWVLYEPNEKKVLFAAGISDLSKIRKVVGWFE
jgi:hypothetical protein